jgi:hypothetical protein
LRAGEPDPVSAGTSKRRRGGTGKLVGGGDYRCGEVPQSREEQDVFDDFMRDLMRESGRGSGEQGGEGEEEMDEYV